MSKLKSILIFVMSLLLLGLFVASTCDKSTNSKNNEDDLIGTWEVTEMSVNGTPMDLDDISIILTINDDRTYSMTMTMGGETQVNETGTWSATDSNFKTTPDDPEEGEAQTIPYTLDGDQLTITLTEDFTDDGIDDNIELTFAKQ